MTDYSTKAVTIGDITLTVSKAKEGDAGSRLEAFLKWLSEKLVDPGYGRPEGGRPDQGLPPGAGRPDNTLPGGGDVDNELPKPPGAPDRPGQPLPGDQPEIDNSLPGFIGANAKEIAAAILRGTACDPVVDNTLPGGPGAQPKR